MTLVQNDKPWIKFEGDGLTKSFDSNFPVGRTGEVKVFVIRSDGTEDELIFPGDFSVVNVGFENDIITVILDDSVPAPENDEEILIFRKSTLDQNLDLQPNGPFLAETFEEQLDRTLAITQELANRVQNSLNRGVVGSTGPFDAQGFKITNVAPGENDGDVATFGQGSSFLDQTKTFRDEAEVFRDEAQTAASSANTSENQAEAARDDAQVAETGAEDARDRAKLAETRSEDAAFRAEQSESTVTTARDEAVNARDTAVSAKDTAVSAKDTAVSARDTAVSAKNTAVSARDDAEAAEVDAEAAEVDAENARDTAVSAKNTAQQLVDGMVFGKVVDLDEHLQNVQDFGQLPVSAPFSDEEAPEFLVHLPNDAGASVNLGSL